MRTDPHIRSVVYPKAVRTWNTALVFIMARSSLFCWKNPFSRLEREMLIFWFTDSRHPASGFEPSNSIFTLSPTQWLFLAEPVILSDNCRRVRRKKTKQGLHIITAISVYPQIPITSLSWSPLMTISTLSVTALYLQLSATRQFTAGRSKLFAEKSK